MRSSTNFDRLYIVLYYRKEENLSLIHICFSIERLISLLLALFSIFISVFFYFKADDASNRSVSYTHLDVYKRQGYKASKLSLIINLSSIT